MNRRAQTTNRNLAFLRALRKGSGLPHLGQSMASSEIIDLQPKHLTRDMAFLKNSEGLNYGSRKNLT